MGSLRLHPFSLHAKVYWLIADEMAGPIIPNRKGLSDSDLATADQRKPKPPHTRPLRFWQNMYLPICGRYPHRLFFDPSPNKIALAPAVLLPEHAVTGAFKESIGVIRFGSEAGLYRVGI
jgi:hypothetical protein